MREASGHCHRFEGKLHGMGDGCIGVVFFLYVRCVEIDCFFFSKNGWSFEMNG